MIEVLRKEFNGFLDSLIAYVVISVFLTGIGLLMWVFPDTSVLSYGYADMDTLFSLGPYVFLFLIPAITMRTFAEEKKSGTLELLFTSPLSDWDIILGKFLAGFLMVLFALIPTVIYYFSLVQLGNPPGNIDTAGVMGSYVGLGLLGAVFTAIGVFASSLSGNQIVSFVVAVFLCFFIYTGFGSLAAIDVWGTWSYFLIQLGVLHHYDALSRGLIDTRNLIYFFSVIAVMLLATKLVIGSRKW